jgi:hypothetical protein
MGKGLSIGIYRLHSNGHGTWYWRVKTKNGWKDVHRIIAEKKYGRRLLKDEVVHHADGNSLNNSPSNLVIWFRDEHGLYHYYLDGVYYPYGD